MKKWLMLMVLCLIASPAALAEGSEIVRVTAGDGYILEGKLDMPAESPDRLVIFVNGSGPNTYDNTRALDEGNTFNYYDVFASELTARGAAFFRASARGCTPGTEPPMYVNIDEAAFQTYVPDNSITDVEAIVTALKADERLRDARVCLIGWSEGTMIATHVARNGRVPIDHLVLCGYVNGTMMEALTWQQTGWASMVFYNLHFDRDGDGIVSMAEFEADPEGILPYLGGVTFDQVDMNVDGMLTAADFEIMLADGWRALSDAIARGDDAYLKEYYPVRLTSAWFKSHEALPPNRAVMPALDLPIDIFHGTADANTSVEGVYDIEAAFKEAGKENLRAHVYEGYDHDLNYAVYLATGNLPEAFVDLLDACAQ